MDSGPIALVSLSKTLNHNCFLRLGCKATGPVYCCVQHFTEPSVHLPQREETQPSVSGIDGCRIAPQHHAEPTLNVQGDTYCLINFQNSAVHLLLNNERFDMPVD